MILTAFDGKFHEEKDEIPPKACRPPKTLQKTMLKKWTPNKLKKNNADKEGPPSPRPPTRPSGGGPGKNIYT